ncbi:putative ribonuclease H-like domain-containing protein [Tanacetum coccineum]
MTILLSISTFKSNDSEGSCGNTSEHSFETESESVSEPSELSKSSMEVTNEKDVSAPKSKEVEPSCVTHIKTPRQPLKDKETHKVNRKNWNDLMERELGEGKLRFRGFVNTVNGYGKTSIDKCKTGLIMANHFVPKITQMANSNAVMGNWGSVVKTSASYTWRNTRPNFHYNRTSTEEHGVRFRSTPSPAKGFACLIAKATSDESKLWHRRTHLAYGFFGPTSVKSINHASYCLVITDDCTRFSWVFFLASKDETSGILQTFIRQIENQLSHRVKIIRSDNGTEFKNRDMLEFLWYKGIKQGYGTARTPQQNGVAERMTRTLIEVARTMLADSLLPTTFWAEAVSTACYISIGVYNLVTKRVEVNLHVNFLEDKPNVKGVGYRWMFDIDYLTDSMNYIPVSLENQANPHAGASEVTNSAGTPTSIASEEKDEEVELIVVPSAVKVPEEKDESRKSSTNSKKEETLTEPPKEKKDSSTDSLEDNPKIQAFRRELEEIALKHLGTLEIFHKPETGIFDEASYDEEGVITDFNSLPTEIEVSPTPTLRIHSIHPKSQILGDPKSAVQTRSKVQNKSGAHALLSHIHKQQRNNHKDQQHCLFACFLSQEEPKKIAEALQDDSWVQAMQEELLQFKLQQVWVLVDLPHGMKVLQEEASLAEAIRLDTEQREEVAKQVHLDSLLAQRIAEEEELNEQQKKRKAQVQFEAQHYTNEDWDLIRAKLEANAELSKSMLGSEAQGEDFAKKMVDLVNQRKKYFAEQRAKAKRNKPMTQTQLKTYMMNYLKNQGTWKLSQLKSLSFEEVKKEFDKLVKQVESFAPISFEATKASLKRFGEELQTKTPKRLKDDKDDEAKDDEQTKKSGKRRKQMARKGLHTSVDKDDSEDSDEVDEQEESVTGTKTPINPVPVAMKTPSIATYKIIKQGEKGAYQIVREDGTDIVYINFGAMMKSISRDDLTELYRIVMNRYGMNGPEDELERVFWNYLKNMFEEPLSTDPIWSEVGQQKIISWRYYESCRVHCLNLESMDVYMLIERTYPLSAEMCKAMLDKKLQGGKPDENCYKMLKMMEKQAGIRK